MINMNITRDEDDYKGNGYKVDAKKTKINFIVITKICRSFCENLWVTK